MSTISIGNETLNLSAINSVGEAFVSINTVMAGIFAIMFFGTIFTILFMRTRRSGMMTALTSTSLAMVTITFYFYLQNYIPFAFPYFWAAILGISATLLYTDGSK